MRHLIPLILSVLSGLFLGCSIEGPLYPTFDWRSVVVFPEYFRIYTIVEGEPGEFYINGDLVDHVNDRGYEIVYKYKDGELNELFRKDVSDEYWSTNRSDYGNGVYWVAGRGRDGDEYYSSVLRVIGELCEELPGPEIDYFYPDLVISIGADEAYFFDGPVRWYFINGEWVQNELPFDYYHTLYVFDRANEILYNYEQPLYKDHYCRISYDYFESYIEEDINLSGNLPLSSSDVYLTKAAVYNGNVYFGATLYTDTRIWYALIERTGAPGNGVYKVIYRRDKALGGWGPIIAPAEGEVLSALPETDLMFYYKNGDTYFEDNAPYDIRNMIFSGGLIWAEGRRREDDGGLYYPVELLVNDGL